MDASEKVTRCKFISSAAKAAAAVGCAICTYRTRNRRTRGVLLGSLRTRCQRGDG